VPAVPDLISSGHEYVGFAQEPFVAAGAYGQRFGEEFADKGGESGPFRRERAIVHGIVTPDSVPAEQIDFDILYAERPFEGADEPDLRSKTLKNPAQGIGLKSGTVVGSPVPGY